MFFPLSSTDFGCGGVWVRRKRRFHLCRIWNRLRRCFSYCIILPQSEYCLWLTPCKTPWSSRLMVKTCPSQESSFLSSSNQVVSVCRNWAQIGRKVIPLNMYWHRKTIQFETTIVQYYATLWVLYDPLKNASLSGQSGKTTAREGFRIGETQDARSPGARVGSMCDESLASGHRSFEIALYRFCQGATSFEQTSLMKCSN